MQIEQLVVASGPVYQVHRCIISPVGLYQNRLSSAPVFKTFKRKRNGNWHKKWIWIYTLSREVKVLYGCYNQWNSSYNINIFRQFMFLVLSNQLSSQNETLRTSCPLITPNQTGACYILNCNDLNDLIMNKFQMNEKHFTYYLLPAGRDRFV